MQWVTRAWPKLDRIACPWLIKRFVDAERQRRYVSQPRSGLAAIYQER